jgi:phosphatidylglycerophosphate synthase
MMPYEPTSRRPIADAFRATAAWPVQWCVRHGVHPDVVSYLSMVASLAAACCFWRARSWPVLLLIGPLFCYARLWCNMLDGMVALASGKASLRGEILNDLPDRISDVMIFTGVAHSGLNAIPSGYWAAILALLTAYIGTFGQAVGGRREFGGMMSKPWRMVTLNIGAWLTWSLLRSPGHRIQFGGLTVLDWTCIVIVAGCVQTSGVRLKRILRALDERGKR